jgi:hypothetical protein
MILRILAIWIITTFTTRAEKIRMIQLLSRYSRQASRETVIGDWCYAAIKLLGLLLGKEVQLRNYRKFITL